MPTQKSAWKWRYYLWWLLARKITKGIHSCKPASLNRPIEVPFPLSLNKIYANEETATDHKIKCPSSLFGSALCSLARNVHTIDTSTQLSKLTSSHSNAVCTCCNIIRCTKPFVNISQRRPEAGDQVFFSFFFIFSWRCFDDLFVCLFFVVVCLLSVFVCLFVFLFVCVWSVLPW